MLKTVQRTIVILITIITIVVFVVIFDDDTYYLLGLLVLRTSLLSLYKVRWSVTAKCKSFFIAKCCVIIKWDSYYKVRQFHHKVRQALQRATIITMWGRTNTRIFLYVQKKPSSETIQFTTAILFCFTSLTFSRISFGIRTFATLNLSFKGQIAWALGHGRLFPRSRAVGHFLSFDHNIPYIPTCEPHKQFGLSLHSTHGLQINVNTLQEKNLSEYFKSWLLFHICS